MKTVKAWEALKAFQEEGRKCRPVGYETFHSPLHYIEENSMVCEKWEFELEPPKPQVVEICVDGTNGAVSFKSAELELLLGKRWRCVCTEITGDE